MVSSTVRYSRLAAGSSTDDDTRHSSASVGVSSTWSIMEVRISHGIRWLAGVGNGMGWSSEG